MSDLVFSNRVKRINKQHKRGKRLHILAGEGDLRATRIDPEGRHVPLLTMLVAAVSGFAALSHARGKIGLTELQALAARPEEVVALAQAQPQLAAALGCLALIALAFPLALFLGRRVGTQLHAFGFAGAAGLVAQQAYVIADPVALAALIAQVTG